MDEIVLPRSRPGPQSFDTGSRLRSGEDKNVYLKMPCVVWVRKFLTDTNERGTFPSPFINSVSVRVGFYKR